MNRYEFMGFVCEYGRLCALCGDPEQKTPELQGEQMMARFAVSHAWDTITAQRDALVTAAEAVLTCSDRRRAERDAQYGEGSYDKALAPSVVEVLDGLRAALGEK